MAKKRPKKLKQFELAKRSEVGPELLPVVQNLCANGYSVADVGILLGYAGKDPEQWLERLRAKCPDLKKALEVGLAVANSELIRTAFQEAVGYWIEEEEIFSEKMTHLPVSDVLNGGPTAPAKQPYQRWEEKNKKVRRKFIQPNTQLLFKLLCNRLPEYFSDTRKIEVDKRTLELKGNIEDEIKGFAGALMEAAGVKQVESKDISETENESL